MDLNLNQTNNIFKKELEEFWEHSRSVHPTTKVFSETPRIAFIGKARAGKDALAEKAFPHVSHYKIAFADALKELYESNFEHIQAKEKPRDAYVTIGNAFREVDPLIWIRKLNDTFLELKDKGVPIILTDVRYPNEVAWCRDNGFLVIKVEADNISRISRSAALGENLDVGNDGDALVDSLKADWVIQNSGYSLLPAIEELNHVLKLYYPKHIKTTIT